MLHFHIRGWWLGCPGRQPKLLEIGVADIGNKECQLHSFRFKPHRRHGAHSRLILGQRTLKDFYAPNLYFPMWVHTRFVKLKPLKLYWLYASYSLQSFHDSTGPAASLWSSTSSHSFHVSSLMGLLRRSLTGEGNNLPRIVVCLWLGASCSIPIGLMKFCERCSPRAINTITRNLGLWGSGGTRCFRSCAFGISLTECRLVWEGFIRGSLHRKAGEC